MHDNYCSALVDYYEAIDKRKKAFPPPPQIATVGRHGARTAKVGDMSFPIWIGKIYEQRARQSDGMMQWRLIGTYGQSRSGFAPSALFIQELSDAAADLGLNFELGITSFQPCDQETN